MTIRLFVFPARRPFPLDVAAVAVAGLVIACRLRWWLAILAAAVGALTLLRAYLRHHMHFVPAVLAGRALCRAGPGTFGGEHDPWTPHWLAILAGGCAAHIDRATTLVHETEPDPWRVLVASARLEAAAELVADGRVAGVGSNRSRASFVLLLAWLGAATVLLWMARDHSAWWLVPTGGTLVGLTWCLVDVDEARVVPLRMAREALDTGGWPRGGDDGSSAPLELLLLAGGDPMPLRRARRLLDHRGGDLPRRAAAICELEEAESMIAPSGPGVAVGLGRLRVWLVAAAAVLLAW